MADVTASLAVAIAVSETLPWIVEMVNAQVSTVESKASMLGLSPEAQAARISLELDSLTADRKMSSGDGE
jgi:hypothetical protein